MIVQELLFLVSEVMVYAGLQSEIPNMSILLSSSLRCLVYTQKRYCYGPCRQGQNHICHGGETVV